jgi:hexosaminidase
MLLRHLLTVATISVTSCHAIWPQPAHIETGSEVLWLDPGLQATLRCEDNGQLREESYVPYDSYLTSLLSQAYRYGQSIVDNLRSNVVDSKRHERRFTEISAVNAAVRDTIKSIHKSQFVPWKLHKRSAKFEPEASASRHYLSTLRIQQSTCPESARFRPAGFFGSDESYELVLSKNGTITLESKSSMGTIRGLQTLQQLFYAHSSSPGAYTPFIPVKIADQPRWSHRGLSIDIARNPYEPYDLFRTIDAMALGKMSRLHIHATDSQSWPLEIPSLPELARKGAYRPELVWTVDDLSDVQMYGASKGVSVFVEIDVPGHTASVAHAYPQLIAAFNELDWSTFALEPLSGQLKLNHSGVTEFMATVLLDLLPRTSRFTSLYHVGGDEVNLAAYLLDETTKSDKHEILQPLLQSFIDFIVDMSIREGLQPIVWEEMLLDWNLTLPSGADGKSHLPALVQVWRNSERIVEVLKRGHRAIFGDYHHWYLDCTFCLSLWQGSP